MDSGHFLNEVDGLPTIGAAIFRSAEINGTRIALSDVNGTLSYNEVIVAVHAVARYLRLSGVSIEVPVILSVRNSIAQVVCHLGILAAGGVSVPLPTNLSASQLVFYLEDTEAKFVLTDSVLEGMSAKATSILVGRQWIDDLVAALPTTEGLEPTYSKGKRSQLACLMYTSGSTAKPKAVRLTHGGVLNSLRNIVEYLNYNGEQREAVVLPLSHSFGLGHVYCLLVTGGFAWIDDGLKRPKRFLAALKEHNITGFPATPTAMQMLMGPYRSLFLQAAKNVSYIVVNSAPLPPEVTSEILAELPEMNVHVYYGLTEASRSTFVNLSNEAAERFRSVGRATPNVEIVARSEAGRDLPAGEEGEIWIAGDHLADGYWHAAEETARAFRDGWLRTGDLGVVDKDGYLFLQGRVTDTINVDGLKVSPLLVEEALKQHPAVGDAAVCGIADPNGILNEVVGALVVLSEEIDVDLLRIDCSERLEKFMVPVLIFAVDEVPRADSGKFVRRKVSELMMRKMEEV